MALALVTGAAGLIGSDTVRFFADLGFDVIGIDNDLRRSFFGDDASTSWNRQDLLNRYPSRFTHVDIDVRNDDAIRALFTRYGSAIKVIIHTAAQPSHDWAVRDPRTDFAVNALATHGLLEACRQYCSDAVFIFTSTNKVYGDTPNRLPLTEYETRFDIARDHLFRDGIDESMSIDGSVHSLFGVSKVAADVLVQEYGRYFGMSTVCFRCGCLTGPSHSASPLHGFLSYLMRCTCTGTRYDILGYKGKQVRDNLHSADLVSAFFEFFRSPRPGEVYNMGGSRLSHCSVLEAIAHSEKISGRRLTWMYQDQPRRGDHIWYISDTRKFQTHYPRWHQAYDLHALMVDIYNRSIDRWRATAAALQE